MQQGRRLLLEPGRGLLQVKGGGSKVQELREGFRGCRRVLPIGLGEVWGSRVAF